jgi:monothiol glutaredoxin
MDALQRIKQKVDENPIIIFMKGSPDFPQCGFSARAS